MSRPPRLGLGPNLGQFTLLVVVNAFVGAMVGPERSILPALAEQEFRLAARTAALSFIVVFGVVKALTNYFAGPGGEGRPDPRPLEAEGAHHRREGAVPLRQGEGGDAAPHRRDRAPHGVRRVTLAPGQTRTVRFTLGPEELRLTDEEMRRVVEPGVFDVLVGTSSANLKAASLGVTAN